MRELLVRWLYARCGNTVRYWAVVAAAQGGSSALVAIVTVLLAATFFDPPALEVVYVAAVGATLTVLAIAAATFRIRPMLLRCSAWLADPDPSLERTGEVWADATTGTWQTFRRSAGTVNLLAVIPAAAIAWWRWDTGAAGFAAMLFACLIPALYGTVVSYSVGELVSRPLIDEIAARVSDEVSFRSGGLSLSRRLKLALPAYTTAAAMATVSLLGHADGARALAITALVSGLVGVLLATELTVLLGDAVTEPVGRMREQLARVQDGDFAARTLVTTGDELGELAHDFNLMTRGLQEREEIRTAFGTYMDSSVVDLILSGDVPAEGVEVTASILFCDVRGFTSYAEQATAPEVIATLNDMFTAIVPVVEKHGGHVDKFLGDGMLAVFGTPIPLADHADRAFAAACEIVDVVSLGSSGLSVGAGVNTGVVVAGPLGGAGRLNFSVIGDAVNVAARVEAATRQTGDGVLITGATRDALQGEWHLVSRGGIELKGKAEPVELFAPAGDADVVVPRLMALPFLRHHRRTR
jgi:class 3 adenylate cyclase